MHDPFFLGDSLVGVALANILVERNDTKNRRKIASIYSINCRVANELEQAFVEESISYFTFRHLVIERLQTKNRFTNIEDKLIRDHAENLLTGVWRAVFHRMGRDGMLQNDLVYEDKKRRHLIRKEGRECHPLPSERANGH